MRDLERIEREAKERQNERIRQYRGRLDIDGTTMLFQQLQLAEAAVDELIAMVKDSHSAGQQAISEIAQLVAGLSGLADQRDEARALADQLAAELRLDFDPRMGPRSTALDAYEKRSWK